MRLVGSLLRGFGTIGASTPAPTLAVVDNGDGTGGTATISGADSGATVTVYSSAFSGTLGTASWVSQGSRSANGSISLSTAVGHYWWYALAVDSNGSTAASSPFYMPLTDAAQSLFYQCLTAAVARIQSLNLPGLENASVTWRSLPIDRALGSGRPIAFPCVLVTPVREAMPATKGLTGLDDVTYGVQITIITADNQEPTLQANLPPYSLWRQKIAWAFRMQQYMPGISVTYKGQTGNPNIMNTIDPTDVVVPAAWGDNLFASGLILRMTCREPRGIN